MINLTICTLTVWFHFLLIGEMFSTLQGLCKRKAQHIEALQAPEIAITVFGLGACVNKYVLPIDYTETTEVWTTDLFYICET